MIVYLYIRTEPQKYSNLNKTLMSGDHSNTKILRIYKWNDS